jgi:hypothetical protein
MMDFILIDLSSCSFQTRRAVLVMARPGGISWSGESLEMLVLLGIIRSRSLQRVFTVH